MSKISKYLSAARSMLEFPGNEDSWHYMLESTHCFIWTDDDTIESWNKIAAKAKLPPVERRVENPPGGERMFLTYKKTTVEVPLTHSSEDGLIVMHTMGRLVRSDSDIRFCLDSWHSSDLAFLVLAPDEWKALEKEFGADSVAYRFLSFPEKLKQFVAKAFSKKNNRRYKPREWPTAKDHTSGKAGALAIALKDDSGTLAGFLLLGNSPIVSSFERHCRFMVPPSAPSSPIKNFLSKRQYGEVELIVEVGLRFARISGLCAPTEGLQIELRKSGAGTWRITDTVGEVLWSGRCNLAEANSAA